MLNNSSSDFELTIRQQPDRARVAGGKEKGTLPGSARGNQPSVDVVDAERKPVDPPPIVQLRVRDQNSYLAQYVPSVRSPRRRG